MCWVSKARHNFVISVSHFTHHSYGHQITPWIFVLRFRQRLMTQGELLIPVSWSGKNQVLWCSWTRRSQAQWLPAFVEPDFVFTCAYPWTPVMNNYSLNSGVAQNSGYPILLNHPQWFKVRLLVISDLEMRQTLDVRVLFSVANTASLRITGKSSVLHWFGSISMFCWNVDILGKIQPLQIIQWHLSRLFQSKVWQDCIGRDLAIEQR